MIENPSPKPSPARWRFGAKLLAGLLAALILSAAVAAATIYAPAASSADSVAAGDVIEYHWQAIASNGTVLASSM